MGRKAKYRFDYKGELMTYAELSKIKGLDVSLINKRISKGWSVEDAATIIPHHIKDRSSAATAKKVKRHKGYKFFAQCNFRINAK